MAITHIEFENRSVYHLTWLDRFKNIHWPIFLVLTVLAGFGGVILYSVAGGSWEPWALDHIRRYALVVAIGIVVCLIDIRIWYRFAYVIFGLSLLLLALVPFIGDLVNDSRRWISVGTFNLQPSEIMQVAAVIGLARFFHDKSHVEIGRFWNLIIPVIMTGAGVTLILFQPDLGTGLKLTAICVMVFFAAGVRWWKFVLVVGAAVASWPLIWGNLASYQQERILVLIGQSTDVQDEAYQITNSITAIGNGGWTGTGYLSGFQTQGGRLPFAENDFVLAAIAEEFGFIGVLIVLAVYAILIIMALVIALRSRNQFGRLIAIGLMSNLFLYVFINAAMIARILPVVGVPLPMISQGGTAMLVTTGIVGLLACVHTHRYVPMERASRGKDYLVDD